jgi:hypothetical protein
MTSSDRLPIAQWADIRRTDRFISVEPFSGYRRSLSEDEGYVIYLAPDASDEELGRVLLECLARSRFIWPLDEPQFFDADRIVQCYRNRQKDFMRRYGYKTKSEAYKTMDWCRVKRSEGKISIQPHRRLKPEEWEWLPPERCVVIPETPQAIAAGAALKLALDRCNA